MKAFALGTKKREMTLAKNDQKEPNSCIVKAIERKLCESEIQTCKLQYMPHFSQPLPLKKVELERNETEIPNGKDKDRSDISM